MSRDNGADTPSVSLRQRVLSPYTLLSLAIAVAFLFFLAVRFDLDWEQTWSNIKALDPLLYVLALLLYYLSFAFRGLRWRILSRSAGIEEIPDARTPSAWRYSQLIVIGWFVNSVAWLRLGDAYRAYALSDEARTGFSWSLGTIFGERVMDMIAVFVLIVVGALAFSLTADFSGTVYVVGAAFVMALALIGVLVVMRGYGPRLARFLPDRLERAYRRFHEGALGSFGELRGAVPPQLCRMATGGRSALFRGTGARFRCVALTDPHRGARPRSVEHRADTWRCWRSRAGRYRATRAGDGPTRRGLRGAGRPLDHLLEYHSHWRGGVLGVEPDEVAEEEQEGGRGGDIGRSSGRFHGVI